MSYDFSKHTFRCSSLGYIMSEPKGKSKKVQYEETLATMNEVMEKYQLMKKDSKSAENTLKRLDKLSSKLEKLELVKDKPHLSDTTLTHLSDVYTRVTTGRTEDIKSKYMEKGLLLEEDAITAYSLLTGEFHKKNKIRERNEFIEGEMDFEDVSDRVLDTKVNWSIFQFNRVASRPIKPLYWWQLQGYCWLFNKSKARLVYTLLNTPEHLIAMEEKRLLYDFVGSEDDYKEACAELRRNHIYDDIPLKDKIRIFDIQRSEEAIERIKSRVIECRTYLNNFNNSTKLDDYEETEMED